jgi:membrane fusion protein (multidrug efflux system)
VFWRGDFHTVPLPGQANRLLAFVAVLLLLAAAPLNAQVPVATVGVIAVPLENVSPGADFVGRVEAINAVDIRARVEGLLVARPFDEGQMVREGQELFLIEKATYEAARDIARAAVLGAQAELRDAEARFQRQQELRRGQVASQAALDEAEAARGRGQAALLTAQAQLQQAELNLSHTAIRAPFAGRIGRAAFAVGGLVGPSSEPLARIVQTDPIRVVFSVSDQSILDFRLNAAAPGQDVTFVPTLVLSSGHAYPHRGEIEFLGNEFDARTGTVPVRARFPNPGGILVPGQFVTLTVRPAEPVRRPVVRLGAVQMDREGRFVLLVEEGDRVALRRIRVGAQIGQNWVVEDGLRGGERVIVQGLQHARPGATVQVVQVPQPAAGVARP